MNEDDIDEINAQICRHPLGGWVTFVELDEYYKMVEELSSRGLDVQELLADEPPLPKLPPPPKWAPRPPALQADGSIRVHLSSKQIAYADKVAEVALGVRERRLAILKAHLAE